MKGPHTAAAARIHGQANRRIGPPAKGLPFAAASSATGRINTQTAEQSDTPAARQLIQKNMVSAYT
ncbi:MAG: hypothetical protein WBA83_05295 [Burkholderiaceae bacterium]